ncbi:hypothetical protein SK128_002438, partial [Halocaridina rubra]
GSTSINTLIHSAAVMVGAYTSLPPAVAATVPRRVPLRDSWIRHPFHSENPTVSITAEVAGTSSPSSTPPMTPTSPRLGGLRQIWDTPRPASVVVTTYTPPNKSANEELHGIEGKVSRAKAFFESAPLHTKEKKPFEMRKQSDDTTVVRYHVKNPYRISPKPKPRRFRNTISTYPQWGLEADEIPMKSDSDSDVQVIITDVSTTASGGNRDEMKSDPPVEITRIKPSYIRRRYGTVTGILSERNDDTEESLHKRLSNELRKYVQETTEETGNRRDAATPDAVDGVGDNYGIQDAPGMVVVIEEEEGSPTTSTASNSSEEVHRARVVLVSAFEGAEEEEEDTLDVSSSVVSLGRDGAWNRRRVVAPSHSPFPSCRCDRAIVVNTDDEGEGPSSTRSECQGSAIAEGHASSKTMVVVPEDGQVQAAGPRVVAACIKSYHDIPEELFNSLQESSVDPHPPPPSPTSSLKGTINIDNAPENTPVVVTPTSRPADWKTMQEGRQALLMGELSDADETEGEGSEVDLGGCVASTSDYHTSDGRGSSLSGASDDHHRHENSHNTDSLNSQHHLKNDYNSIYNHNNEYHLQNVQGKLA